MDEAFLSGLRDLLQEQCRVPELPRGWRCTSAMLAAHGFAYGGDFFVADRRLSDDGRDRLEMVLVDVCGKGATALPDAVQLAGALRGLLTAVPEAQVLAATNTYLLRLPSDESIATAVQVSVDLSSGRYTVRSAGHPPVLRWTGTDCELALDNARGTALGVVEDPELDISEGILLPGDALVFYTDGVVERPDSDIDTGISWLLYAARRALTTAPVADLPARILEQVARGDDDRAVLVLTRE
ncbi:serine/threonine-protein phosphatase [Nocardioides humilatus]|uniref:Serine/threonine-protein phosphatase n=1 Tax=Nocardioides humilatus TaxID=2607660 RepID=A0A5B1L5U7_9ACTN|nr:PP2C family protein-serine/threonine phosphatase [Nocardioides humilatus]KAA1415826.1 serine/threonine-protein phosphatase [Nocardioides humilatus]